MELYPPFQKPEIPVKVAAPVKGFSTDSMDPEDWTYPERYRVKREFLRSMGPHGLYAYCALQQAIADAGLSETEISNDETGLFAASAGSPHLLTYFVQKMNTQGVMKCSPLGIVASIAGTVQFNLVAHFKIKGASTGFASACARRPTPSAMRMTKSPSAGSSGCSSSARRTEMWRRSFPSPACARSR